MAVPLRILVVDDDPVMRELLEMLLELSGHVVTTVVSGEAALEQIAAPTAAFDVVLTDLHMPGLQGDALAARLNAARPAGALLVGMSGSAPSRQEQMLLDDFLQKPFTPAQFEEVVEAARSGAPRRTVPKSPGEALRRPAVTPNGLPHDGDGSFNEEVFTRLKAALPMEQLRELFLMTIEDVLGRVETMRAAVAVGDLEAARREAHAIKGGSGMAGAAEIYRLAAQAEVAEDAGGLNLDAFAPACERLKRMLDARLNFTAPLP